MLGGVHAEGAAVPSSWADGVGAAALDPPATVVEVGAGAAVVDVGAGASVDVDAGAAVVGSGATVDEGTGASVVNAAAPNPQLVVVHQTGAVGPTGKSHRSMIRRVSALKSV